MVVIFNTNVSLYHATFYKTELTSPKSIIQFWWMIKYCTIKGHVMQHINFDIIGSIYLLISYLVSIVNHETVKMTRNCKAQPFYQRTTNLQLCVAIWNSLASQKISKLSFIHSLWHSFLQTLFSLVFHFW